MNTPRPALSIGMPVYNGEATVGAAIRSLLAQSFTDFELIVSDNASSDGTEALCRQLAATDPRVRYLRQPRNLGPIANFELVLAEASAPLFMWAASDDRWHADFAAANIAALGDHPGAVSSVSRVEMPSVPDPGTAPLTGGFMRRVRRLLAEDAANSRYYGVWRTDVLRRAVREGSGAFIAADWAIIIAACRHGDFIEVDRVLMSRGGRGASTSWRRQMALFGSRGIDRILPAWPFTRWLIRNLSARELLGCLDLVARRNFSITRSYLVEVVREPRDPYRHQGRAVTGAPTSQS